MMGNENCAFTCTFNVRISLIEAMACHVCNGNSFDGIFATNEVRAQF